MITASINGEMVDVEIIEADGRSGTTLDGAELDLIAAVDARLREHSAFASAYPHARLTRIDSNRMLQDSEEGRFYLRYHYDGGEAEFWGHQAGALSIDFERGIVAVTIDASAI